MHLDDRSNDLSTLPAASSGRRARVLFIAEAVTLAHLARPIALARGLDPSRYDVVLAADPRYQALLPESGIPLRPIYSIPGEQFLEAKARGCPMYEPETIRGYVREDLEVLEETSPDVVVGDFRLSLAISARLAGIPYLTISNAYWSPHAQLRFPMPELPLTRQVGLPLARALFGLVRPWAFAYHSRAVNRVREEFGLTPLGFDLRRIYTEADHTLYADVAGFVPMVGLPDNHHFLGPILWSPAVAPPPWWENVPSDRPAIYVNLGASGRGELLGMVLDALAECPVIVLAATAGRADPGTPPPNARVAPFLPGEEAAARSCLVICNGGSLTTQQALSAGTPVLGLVSNMDQHLNMGAVQRHGAGELLRAETATRDAVLAAVDRILSQSSYREAATVLARDYASYREPARFPAILSAILGGPPSDRALADAPGAGRG